MPSASPASWRRRSRRRDVRGGRQVIGSVVAVHAVLGVAAAGRPWVSALLLVILAVGAVELRHAWQRMPVPRPAHVWLIFSGVIRPRSSGTCAGAGAAPAQAEWPP